MTTEFQALQEQVARAITEIKALSDKVSAVPPSDTQAIVDLTAQLKAASDAAEAVLNQPA